MYYQYTIVVCVFNVIPCSSYVLKQTDGLTLTYMSVDICIRTH